jgi:hypothetical protein
MNMPGFTAEASLNRTSEHYGMAATFEATQLAATLYPSRATGPFGPIGFPGQDCGGACWHVCMSSGLGHGPFFDHCIDNCQRSCGETSFVSRL